MWSSHDSYMHIAHPVNEDKQTLSSYRYLCFDANGTYAERKYSPETFRLDEVTLYFVNCNLL